MKPALTVGPMRAGHKRALVTGSSSSGKTSFEYFAPPTEKLAENSTKLHQLCTKLHHLCTNISLLARDYFTLGKIQVK
jgi:hypothetical protein